MVPSPEKNGTGPPPKAKDDVSVAKAALFSGLEEAQARILNLMNIAAPKKAEADAGLAAAVAEGSSAEAEKATATSDASASSSGLPIAAGVPAKAAAPKDGIAKPPSLAALGAAELNIGAGKAPEQPPVMAKVPKALQLLKAGSLAGSLASLGKVTPKQQKALDVKPPFTKQQQYPMQAGRMSEPKLSGMAMLMAAAAREEEAKAAAAAAAAAKAAAAMPKGPVRPLSGYARASMMNRLAEASDPTDVEAMTRNMVRQTDQVNPVTGEKEKPAGDEPSLRIFLGNVPHGTGEGLIRAECIKYGEINSMICKTEPGLDSFQLGWAIISYSAPEMAAYAVQRMSKKRTMFGSSERVEVRFATTQDLRDNGLLIEEPAAEPAEAAETAEGETGKEATSEQTKADEQGDSADADKSTAKADGEAETKDSKGEEAEPAEQAKADRSRSRSGATRPAATAAAGDEPDEPRDSRDEPAESSAVDRGHRSGMRERRRGAESDRGRNDRADAEVDGPEHDRGRGERDSAERERGRGDRVERGNGAERERGRGDRMGGERDGADRERRRGDRADRDSAAHHSERRPRGRDRECDEFSWSPRDEGSMAARRMEGEALVEDRGHGAHRREDRYDRHQRRQHEDYRQQRYEDYPPPRRQEDHRHARHDRNQRYEEDYGDRYDERDRGQYKRHDDRLGGQPKRRRCDKEYERVDEDYYEYRRDDHRGGGRQNFGRDGGCSGRRKRVELEPARAKRGRWTRDGQADRGRHNQQDDFEDCDDFDSRDDVDSRDGQDQRNVRGARDAREARSGRDAREMNHRRH